MTLSREASAGYMTAWAARAFAKAVDKRLKAIGLSSGQLAVFFALGEGAALSQATLVRVAAIEQPTMAATLSRMERDGLIARRPDPEDGRSSLISLTPAGVAKMPAVRDAVSSVNAAALSGVDAGEAATLLRLLASVVKALEDQA